MTKKYDFLVIGSGIAGMSFALKVASKGKVALICKTTLDEANTALAQGGVASVTNMEVDDFDKHIHDTMVAGDWLSDPEAVKKVVTGAPEQIRQLIRWGVDFDKKDDGSFDLHREGGHSEFRILHHADNTGFEIQESLIEAVRSNPDIDIFENHFAIEIITQHHLGKVVTRRTPDITCYGAYVLNPEGGVDTFLAKVTLMATGGAGAVYLTTTNPLVATGDGIAMVYGIHPVPPHGAVPSRRPPVVPHHRGHARLRGHIAQPEGRTFHGTIRQPHGTCPARRSCPCHRL